MNIKWRLTIEFLVWLWNVLSLSWPVFISAFIFIQSHIHMYHQPTQCSTVDCVMIFFDTEHLYKIKISSQLHVIEAQERHENIFIFTVYTVIISTDMPLSCIDIRYWVSYNPEICRKSWKMTSRKKIRFLGLAQIYIFSDA